MNKIKLYVDDVLVFQKEEGVVPPVIPPTPPIPPIPPVIQPPPNSIPMVFGAASVLDLCVGVTRVLSCSVMEACKDGVKLNWYGLTPTANAIYKWLFPDGTEFPKYFIDRGLYVPDTIVGSSSSGGFEVRAKNSSIPNVDYLSIPTGTHLLQITAIAGSSIKIWASLKP